MGVEFAGILTAVAGVISSLLGAVISYYFGRRGPQESDSLESRISRLGKALQESSALISEMESEIQDRHKLAAKLAKDAESYQQLITLNREQVEAISSALRTEIAAEGKRAFWKNFAQNLGFFVAGAVASLFIAILLR
jgi:ABC-type multidrug transport system fused ATPase/permease subunit